MTETIRIGDPIVTSKEPPRSPLRHLPNRLDAQACLTILERLHPDWTAASITAAGKHLDMYEINICLEHTSLSLEDKMIFKAALSEHGIIARGKRIS
jgi:hypothetical protein